MPAFVIDLPGGGGKRLVSTYDSYIAGKATYTAPGLPGTKGITRYTYHDPATVQAEVLEEYRQHQDHALERGETLEQFIAKFGVGTVTQAARRPIPRHTNTTPPIPNSGILTPNPPYVSAKQQEMAATG